MNQFKIGQRWAQDKNPYVRCHSMIEEIISISSNNVLETRIVDMLCNDICRLERKSFVGQLYEGLSPTYGIYLLPNQDKPENL